MNGFSKAALAEYEADEQYINEWQIGDRVEFPCTGVIISIIGDDAVVSASDGEEHIFPLGALE